MATASELSAVRWYFDESLLGAAKVLLTTRDDVVHPGHRLIPELTLGIQDTEWIAQVARAGWVAFVRDRRIRTRAAEARALHEGGLKVVFFGGKRDLRPSEQAELFTRHLVRLEREIVKRGEGPWALNLTGAGLAPLNLSV
jgi:hypothetical protein